MNTLLKIGNYELVSTELDEGFYYGFRLQRPHGLDTLYLHKDGTFRPWIVPYFSTLDEIIAAFKKYLTTAELLKLKFSSDIAQMIDAQ